MHQGLSSDEDREILRKAGPNEIPDKDESTFHRIFRKFWGPIPWMIEAAAVLSALVQKWEDFTIILIMLFVNAILDFYQKSKALSAIKALEKTLAQKSLVLRDGKWREINARELVPGDIIKIKIGDIVPADVQLLSGDSILVDQSALTGESLPANKNTGDEVYGNSIIKKGEMIAQVIKTGLDTYFGKTVCITCSGHQPSEMVFYHPNA